MAGYARKEASMALHDDGKRLKTDRAAYIAFLENQLEQVSANSLLTSGFNERIEQVQTQISTLEEKVMNVSRVVKLVKLGTEQAASGQEAQSGKMEEQLASMVSRFDETERKIAILERRPFIELHDFDRVKSLEERLVKIEETFAPGVCAQPTDIDMQIAHQIAPMKQSVFLTEQTCCRLADDALSAVERNQRRVQEVKDEMHFGLDELRRDFMGSRNFVSTRIDDSPFSKPAEVGCQVTARVCTEDASQTELNAKINRVEEIERQLSHTCRTQLAKIENMERKLSSEFGMQIGNVTELVKKMAKTKLLAANGGVQINDRRLRADRSQSPGINPNTFSARVHSRPRSAFKQPKSSAVRSQSADMMRPRVPRVTNQRSRTVSSGLVPEEAQRRAKLRVKQALSREPGKVAARGKPAVAGQRPKVCAMRRKAIDDLYQELRLLETEEFGVSRR